MQMQISTSLDVVVVVFLAVDGLCLYVSVRRGGFFIFNLRARLFNLRARLLVVVLLIVV